jgi:hypothetical protein
MPELNFLGTFVEAQQLLFVKKQVSKVCYLMSELLRFNGFVKAKQIIGCIDPDPSLLCFN